MSLYQKYRPQTFEDVVGNDDTIAALQSTLDRKTHAYLLCGPAGCGKTTLGRILARSMGCKGNDFRELDSADFRGIDTIRDIRRQVAYRPNEGTCRVWLLDECHMLTNEAANALLKVLEEPPEWVHFILCTTNPEKLLPTIRSRCSTHTVAPLNETEMRRLLRRVVKEEGATLDKSVYNQIAQDSLGHPRAALTILEKVIDLPADQQLAAAEQAAMATSQSIELCRALLGNKPWKQVRQILNGLEQEPAERIRRAVIGYTEKVIRNNDKVQPLADIILEEFIEPFFDSGMPQLVLACRRVVAGGDQ